MSDMPEVNSFDLPHLNREAYASVRVQGTRDSLPGPMLYRNLMWFIHLRWVVVVILTVFTISGYIPGLFHSLGLRHYIYWPLIAAGVLLFANLMFLWNAKRLARKPTSHGGRVNLRMQIVVDLLVLTVVIHFVGSLETFVPFSYLFHIVLACIFYRRAESFVVTALACVLYILCVILEIVGVVPSAGIFINQSVRNYTNPGIIAVNVGSAVAIWIVVWYLTSRLSSMLKKRDHELDITNQQLVEAQKERKRHLLRTTHELKAPFAAIDANAQVLLRGYCGELPPQAFDVVKRISERCRKLATEIQEMLQLANLRHVDEKTLVWSKLNIDEILGWCVEKVEPLAQEKGVFLCLDFSRFKVLGVEEHLKMLFNNLVTNAILYSNDGGRVYVSCKTLTDGTAEVVIRDEGIGIHPDKLPKIFDEYYRTQEAVKHNKQSTGLGLSIVKRIALTHGIRIRVESSPGAGTKFILSFSHG